MNRAAEFSARASDALWRALVENVPYYVALISPDRRLVYLNRALGRRPVTELTGQSIEELIPHTAAVHEAINRVLAGGAAEHLEAPLSLDSVRWFELHLSPIRADDGDPLGLLAVGIETTENRQTAIELRMTVNALHRLIEAREQLSADLHDGILQSLYGVGLRLEAARAAQPQGPAAVEAHLSRAIGQLNDTMKEIRRYIADDRSTASMPVQWEDTLTGVLRGLEVEGGPALLVDLPRDLAAGVPAGLRGDLVLIAREAVSNAMRHSGATRVAVRLSRDDGTIRLEVEDNGAGFDGQVTPEGFGLLTMTRRAGQIGAILTMHSTPGAGTTVRLDCPVT